MTEKSLGEVGCSTVAIHAGQMRSLFAETCEAVYLTSGFVYKTCREAQEAFDGTKKRYMYGRYGNPTNTMFEKRLAAIEGSKYCMGVCSGMAAVTSALLCMLSPGDRVVSSTALFGNCFWVINTLLPQLGVEVITVDGTDLGQWKRALSKPTKVVFFETPSNPTLQLIDVESVCRIAKKVGARVIVDNVFATPIGQKNLPQGAHSVVYSTTKHMDGQGRCLGGAILTNDKVWFEETLFPYVRNTGPCLSPFNAWTMLKGLETLSLRVKSQTDNALRLAKFLETVPQVQRVLYPGLKGHPQHALAVKQMRNFGTIIGLYINGGKTDTYRALDRLKIIALSNNLGDVKSLIISPATTTHSKISETERIDVGITDNFVRLSVGLEDVEDLQNDFLQAFRA